VKKIKAFTLIELLIVVAIIAILAAIAVPNFLEAQIRSKVARAKTDMRSVATALEAYFVDNNQYPAWAVLDNSGKIVGANLTVNVDYGKIPTGADYDMRSFAIAPSGTAKMFSLTTPLGYMTSFPADTFGGVPGATFGYYSDPTYVGWILYSPGPDGDGSAGGGSTLNIDAESVYSPFVTQPSVTLTALGSYNYDSTNGTSSVGDVFRVKQ